MTREQFSLAVKEALESADTYEELMALYDDLAQLTQSSEKKGELK